MAILFWKKATPVVIGVGLVAKDVVALLLYFAHMEPWGLNLGLVALVINMCGSRLSPKVNASPLSRSIPIRPMMTCGRQVSALDKRNAASQIPSMGDA
jgi:hypothetical protein